MKLVLFICLIFLSINECVFQTTSTATANVTQVICPDNCNCNSTAVDCSGKSLKTWPTDIPLNVTTLILTDNRISKIPDGALSRLPQLQELILDENRIVKLEIKVPILLVTISAKGNNIKTFQITNNNTALKRLYLNDNKLTTVPLLPNSLEYLDLEQNRIKTLEKNKFAELVNLKELYLKTNLINLIANDTFNNLMSLEVFDISLNQITELHNEWFLNKPNLRVVEVRTFKLNCDCELLDIYDQLINHNLDVDDLLQLGCFTPETIRGLLVKDVVENKNITGCKMPSSGPTKTPMLDSKQFHNRVAILGGVIGSITGLVVIGAVVWWVQLRKTGYAVV